nr:hypothetical protein [Porphyromonas gulae]
MGSKKFSRQNEKLPAPRFWRP